MKYKYKIFAQDTSIREGYTEDVSRENVITKLQAEGNIVINVEETLVSSEGSIFDRFSKKITNKDIVLADRKSVV